MCVVVLIVSLANVNDLQLQKKAEYIKKTTKMLLDKFKCDIPNSVEGLVSVVLVFCVCFTSLVCCNYCCRCPCLGLVQRWPT